MPRPAGRRPAATRPVATHRTPWPSDQMLVSGMRSSACVGEYRSGVFVEYVVHRTTSHPYVSTSVVMTVVISAWASRAPRRGGQSWWPVVASIWVGRTPCVVSRRRGRSPVVALRSSLIGSDISGSDIPYIYPPSIRIHVAPRAAGARGGAGPLLSERVVMRKIFYHYNTRSSIYYTLKPFVQIQ